MFLSAYVKQQPAGRQAFHRWMKRLEVVSLLLSLGILVLALYVSVSGADLRVSTVVATWLALPASLCLLLLLISLHAAGLSIFPPVAILGQSARISTSHTARNTGRGMVLVALILGAYWWVFVYAVGAENAALTTICAQLLGVASVLGVSAAIALQICQQIRRR